MNDSEIFIVGAHGQLGIAPRPLKSTLDLNKLHATGFKSKDWLDDLARYVERETT